MSVGIGLVLWTIVWTAGCRSTPPIPLEDGTSPRSVLMVELPRRGPMVIVTDLAYDSDDSVALLALLSSGRFDVRGIVTTPGNVTAEQAFADATRLLAATGFAGVPVAQGPPMSALESRRRYYVDVERPSWGRSAYVGALGAQPTTPAPEAAHDAGAKFLVDLLNQGPQSTVVLLGPATVLAQALRLDPRLPDHVGTLVVMGGAVNVPGNVTPAAEFNVWFDPEAMALVLAQPSHTVLVPLDATNGVEYRRPGPTPIGDRNLALTHLELVGGRAPRARMWDEVVAAILLDPSLAERALDARVSVSTARDPSYGHTTAESVAPGGRWVVTAVDRLRVEDVLRRALASP